MALDTAGDMSKAESVKSYLVKWQQPAGLFTCPY
jgi:hypothetical protein